MKALSSNILKIENLYKALFDFGALAFVYFTPALSHLFALPIYLIEPMRLVLIMAIAHSNKSNALVLACTLPIFSFIVSSHPVFAKAMLIGVELILNAFIFFKLKDKMNNLFVAGLISILISKIAYYAVKAGLIYTAILQTELISTPLEIQAITTIIYSFYLYWFLREKVSK
jgi:hypothetical protein